MIGQGRKVFMDVSELEKRLIEHRVRDNARFNELSNRVDALSGEKEKTMSEVRNVFEPGFGTGGANAGWGAGIGGLIGAAIGNGGFGGFGGNREQVATLDQVDSRFNALQGQMASDSLREQNADTAIALGAGIAGVKDAVNHNGAHNQLAMAGLGYSVQSGFASVNQSILLQGAASRELALQQALDAERARATELRIALSETKNQAGHTATQVLVQQLVNQGNP